MKRQSLLVFLAGIAFGWLAQNPLAKAQELTLESIFSPSGLTGRGPDNIQWSPDGTRVSFIIHQEPGTSGEKQADKSDLYVIDAATGK